MAVREVVSETKQKVENIIFLIIVIFVAYFAYKTFFKKEPVYEVTGEGDVFQAQELSLYPVFSIKIQDVLSDEEFKKLGIFSMPIKESGYTGNPNPFLPFNKE